MFTLSMCQWNLLHADDEIILSMSDCMLHEFSRGVIIGHLIACVATSPADAAVFKEIKDAGSGISLTHDILNKKHGK